MGSHSTGWNTTWWAASTQIKFFSFCQNFQKELTFLCWKFNQGSQIWTHALSNKVSKIKISLTENTPKKLCKIQWFDCIYFAYAEIFNIKNSSVKPKTSNYIKLFSTWVPKLLRYYKNNLKNYSTIKYSHNKIKWLWANICAQDITPIKGIAQSNIAQFNNYSQLAT